MSCKYTFGVCDHLFCSCSFQVSYLDILGVVINDQQVHLLFHLNKSVATFCHGSSAKRMGSVADDVGSS